MCQKIISQLAADGMLYKDGTRLTTHFLNATKYILVNTQISQKVEISRFNYGKLNASGNRFEST